MKMGPTAALLPVARARLPVPGSGRNNGSPAPADMHKLFRDVVFLGYGPPSGQGLYDDAGRHVASRGLQGSMVDLYV